MVNTGLLRAVAAQLRDEPSLYDQTTLEGVASSPMSGDSTACDIIGHILAAVGCKRLYGVTGYQRPIWVLSTNQKLRDPIDHALTSLELPPEETANWFRADWTPPDRYGVGAEAVAGYLEAVAHHAEFLESFER